MIQANEIMDELWKLYFWVVKSVFVTIAWSVHLVLMILFSAVQRLFHAAGKLRNYVEQWNPIRPGVFEFR